MTESGGETSIFGQNLVGVTGFEPAASTSQRRNLISFAWEMLFFARFLRVSRGSKPDISDISDGYIAETGQNCGQTWSAVSEYIDY